jgi:hypothetical protein
MQADWNLINFGRIGDDRIWHQQKSPAEALGVAQSPKTNERDKGEITARGSDRQEKNCDYWIKFHVQTIRCQQMGYRAPIPDLAGRPNTLPAPADRSWRAAASSKLCAEDTVFTGRLSQFRPMTNGFTKAPSSARMS